MDLEGLKKPRIGPNIKPRAKPKAAPVKEEPVANKAKSRPKRAETTTASGMFSLGPAKAAPKAKKQDTNVELIGIQAQNVVVEEAMDIVEQELGDYWDPQLVTTQLGYSSMTEGKPMLFQLPLVMPNLNMGELRMHKSGRMTIKIGNVVFNVIRAPQATYSTVMASIEPQTVTFLGAMQDQFVVAPDIESILL